MWHSLLNSSGSLPFPRDDPPARSLNLPPDATRLSCLQLIMRHDLLFLLFCILHLTLPHAAPPPLGGPLLPEARSLPATVPPVHRRRGGSGRRAGGQAGRKEGHKHADI